MHATASLIVASCTALTLAVISDTAVADEKDVVRGRELAQTLCAGCHLNPGQGEKSGPHGVPAFSAIADRPQQTLHGVIKWLESRPVMMPDHRLTRDETYLLAQFIMSLRTEP